MIEHPHTDKIRFVDLGVESSPDAWVHTVEVSDDRSVGHFITAFTCGKKGQSEIPHNPDLYHRDDPSAMWVNRHFHRKVRQQWTEHLHWTFDRAPDLLNVVAVLLGLGKAIRSELANEIADHYRNQEAKAA